MTASEKTIERLESVMRIVQGETHTSDLRAAAAALRACEKIRELIEIDRISHDTVQIFELEELLPK